MTTPKWRDSTTLRPRSRDYAEKLIGSLPDDLVQAAHEPSGARAVVYALLIDDDAEARLRQLEELPGIAEAGAWELALRLHPRW